MIYNKGNNHIIIIHLLLLMPIIFNSDVFDSLCKLFSLLINCFFCSAVQCAPRPKTGNPTQSTRTNQSYWKSSNVDLQSKCNRSKSSVTIGMEK